MSQEEVSSKTKENTIVFNEIEYKLVEVLSETRKSSKIKKHSEEIFYVIRSIKVDRCSYARERLGSTSKKVNDQKGTGTVRLLIHMTIDIEMVQTTFISKGVTSVRRILYRSDHVQKFIREFRTMVKILKERVSRYDDSRLCKEIQNFANYVHQRLHLKDVECSDDWLKTMYVAIVGSMMGEMLKFVSKKMKGGQYVRQILDDFIGIKTLAESGYAERKLFLTCMVLLPLLTRAFLLSCIIIYTHIKLTPCSNTQRFRWLELKVLCGTKSIYAMVRQRM